jgi:uncharacterized phiE125 gp8 family phage protein
MMDWTGFRVVTAATFEPVTVAELKTYARIDGTDYDSMLSGYISACRAALEKHTGRTFLTTSCELSLDSFPEDNGAIELPYPPVQSVTSIYYNQESDGVNTLLAASLYQTDLYSVYPRIIPAYDEDWPDTRDMLNAVRVTYVTGYGDDDSDVPAAIRECIKALATDLFEHPETNVELRLEENRTYKFLLNAYSIPGCV